MALRVRGPLCVRGQIKTGWKGPGLLSCLAYTTMRRGSQEDTSLGPHLDMDPGGSLRLNVSVVYKKTSLTVTEVKRYNCTMVVTMVEIQVANQMLARDLKMAVQHRARGPGNSETACSSPCK